ncbi:hypothetical protein [Pandoravirus japonicus]|uniref:Uncharacterized protein n=1 Tax=Pandoravirus japonicus TaxID=2823154 RepID=A0A811BMH4_9VIRU|nr:hypothetical protein [Pandoravirus japonicus]BCU03154.1 hypothetical protein [Pandoravirus japonicus]
MQTGDHADGCSGRAATGARGDEGDGKATSGGADEARAAMLFLLPPRDSWPRKPTLRFVGSAHKRAEARLRAAELRREAEGAVRPSSGPAADTTIGGPGRSAPASRSWARTDGDNDSTVEVTGAKRTRDATIDGGSAYRDVSGPRSCRRHRQSVAEVTDALHDDAVRADRLRRDLVAAAALPEPGLVLQAMARLQSLYAPEETRAPVAEAYATVMPLAHAGTNDDNNDDDSDHYDLKVPGPRAPTAFVKWFAANHEAYGLANTPDCIWNTMVPPRSPGGDADPWSRAYWLAGDKP